MHRTPYNKNLKPLARKLRHSMTDAERRLWSRIRRKQIYGRQFYRQKPVGNYIVDFYCPSAKLIIEIDGGQHFLKEAMAKDQNRDNYLHNLGFTVLRFSNVEIFKNIEGVVQKIAHFIQSL